MPQRTIYGLVAVVIGLALFWNWAFVTGCGLPSVLAMNDVAPILAGYKQTPHLLADSLRWWHGPWIEDGIHVFRPLSSYLLWVETWIGLHWGFLWVGWMGFGLFVVDCLLCCALAWRFTRSQACTLLAGALGSALPRFNWGGATPKDWLAWYPAHQDLMLAGFLLGALYGLDVWLETTRPKPLALFWLCFLLSLLTKETGYIFPAMALTLAWSKPNYVIVKRGAFLAQIGGMLGAALLFYLYRWLVIVAPYNPPPLKWVHILRKPFLYWFFSFYGYLLTATYWYPGLALLLVLLIGGIVKLRQGAGAIWFARPYSKLLTGLIVVGVLWIYCNVAFASLSEAILYIFDGGATKTQRLSELLGMMSVLYTLYLLWKYRRQEPSLAAWAIMALAYIPVFTYLGWHYTLLGWFLRSALYWPIVAKLVWRNTIARKD